VAQAERVSTPARQTVAAAVIYLAITALFFAPGLLPGKTLSSSDTLWFDPPWLAQKPAELVIPSNPDLADAPDQMQLLLRLAAREMPHIPLWNPYIMGGRPLHGNDQTAVFGPYTWPVYILPFWTALSWIAVLKLWVAAFGTFLLARSLGVRFGGALLAGIVFALSLKLVTWVIYPSMGVWTWYPLLLYCVERLVRRPDPVAGAGLAAVVALQFLTGHPESSFHAAVLATSFFVLRVWQARRAGDPAAARLVRPLLGFAGAWVLGAAVAAVALIPFVELLWQSADFVDRRGESVDNSLALKEAIGIFLPDYWGRPTQTPIRPIMLERALYVGALPLMLAAAALLLRPTVTRIAVGIFGAFWACVVLGIPPFVQVVTRLPVFNSGHNTRLIVFSILAVALLAGWGLDDLSSGRRFARAARARTLAVGAGLLALPVLLIAVASGGALGALRGGVEIAWLFADPPGQFRDLQGIDVIRASSLIIWLTVAGAGLALILLRLRGKIGTTAVVVLALVLVCADLFRTGMGQNPAIDRDYASVPKTGAVRYLERFNPTRFVSTKEIPQNVIPWEFHLYEGRGYDIPIVKRYDRLWRREIVPGAPSVAAAFIDIPLELRDVTPRALRTLRLLGVTHLLAPKTVRPEHPPFEPPVAVPPLSLPGLDLVYDRADARVYRLDDALPRAWVVNAQQVVSGEDEALETLVRPGFDARAAAITEKRLPGLPDAAPAGERGAGGARIARYDPERVELQAQTDRPGLVVLNDTWFPGWKAHVDGREVPIERVDYVFRGVRVGPGKHTIEFTYEPLSFRVGWIISLVGLLGLAVMLAVGLRARRRGATGP
jgi:hypothetical protein